MFTCPTNEIHSLYLDNELPQNYVGEYEAHIASCEKCRAQLNKLKAVHEAFKADAQAVSPDKEFLDKSYERLMLKMKYSRTSGRSTYKASGRVWKIAVPAIAAAAVLATVIPVGINAGKHNVKTMSASSSLYSQMPAQISEQFTDVAFGGENGIGFNNGVQKVLPSASLENQDAIVTNVSNVKGSASKLIQDVEVFRPKFEEDKKTISIRITVPGADDVPVTAEIQLPLDVTGQQ